jgi:hypothetical protein
MLGKNIIILGKEAEKMCGSFITLKGMFIVIIPPAKSHLQDFPQPPNSHYQLVIKHSKYDISYSNHNFLPLGPKMLLVI